MAVATSIIDVNNGNAGWTKANVMDALETAFTQLGFNAGTEVTGVPQACITPTGNHAVVGSVETDWDQASNGDAAPDIGDWSGSKLHRFTVEEVGSEYRVLKQAEHETYAPYHFGVLDATTNEVTATRHGFTTGDSVRYLPGETDSAYAIGDLNPDTLVYIIVTGRDKFKVATSAANAAADTEITLDSVASSGKTFPVVWQQEVSAENDYINPTLKIYQGDEIELVSDAGNSTNITICADTATFNTNQRVVIGDSVYGSYPYDSYSSRANPTNISCVPGATLKWETATWPQTETERTVPLELQNPSVQDVPGEAGNGICNYIYCSETTSTAIGAIEILPSHISYNGARYPYWKYTVPASGSRSELKLRVWRYGYSNGKVANVTIHSVGSGWSNNEVFTIPGELVGGTATTGDIRFGVRSPETSSGGNDGTATLTVTTLGGGSSMFQKHKDGNFGILKVLNDATKKYSHTYYSFLLKSQNTSSWRFYVKCGNGWDWLNYPGTSSDENYGQEFGEFSGYEGLDKQKSYESLEENGEVIDISVNSTPTSYPLQIRTYRAQAPQDTNFAVIQFCSIVNSVVQPYATFNLPIGSNHGSGVFDLDDVFLAGLVTYGGSGRDLEIKTIMPGWTNSSSDTGPAHEPVEDQSMARSAYYGYMRVNGVNAYNNSVTDKYSHNIDANTHDVRTIYYRNSTYDGYDGQYVSSNADWFKPIKTIPQSAKMIPCPYYLPDDFVILQVSTTPGLTDFRPGDTITVSGSEVYTVVYPVYETQQNGLDGITNNSTMGTLFLARTT